MPSNVTVRAKLLGKRHRWVYLREMLGIEVERCRVRYPVPAAGKKKIQDAVGVGTPVVLSRIASRGPENYFMAQIGRRLRRGTCIHELKILPIL
jgi:hypothetical protein